MSSRAIEILLSACGNKLISNVRTRWNSTFLILDWLLEVRGPLSTALDKLKWENLAHSEWKVLECVHKLLQPFAQYTAFNLQRRVHNTVQCCAHPNGATTALARHDECAIDCCCSHHSTVRAESPILSTHGPWRWKPWAIYIVSTILDQWYKPLIKTVQLKSGREELLRMLKHNGGPSYGSQNSTQLSPTHSPE